MNGSGSVNGIKSLLLLNKDKRMMIKKIKSKLEALWFKNEEDTIFGNQRKDRCLAKPDAQFISDLTEHDPLAMALLFTRWIESEAMQGIKRVITLLKHTDITLLTNIKSYLSDQHYKNLQLYILESAIADHGTDPEMELYRETIGLVKNAYRNDLFKNKMVPFNIFDKLSACNPQALDFMFVDYSDREIAMVIGFMSEETARAFLAVGNAERNTGVLELLQRGTAYAPEEYLRLIDKLEVDYHTHCE